MEFEVLTWNVDWFRNGRHSNNDSSIYLIKDFDKNAFDGIWNEISKFFNEDTPINKIAFIQECPYKYQNDKGEWLELDCWKDLKQKCSDAGLNLFISLDDRNGYVKRKTIAIARKGVFTQFSLDHNRLVAVEKGGIILVGVHMPTIGCLTDKNDTTRIMLKELAKNKNKLIIAGDFNTFIGCNSKSTEYRYRELLSLADNIVVESINTFKDKTSIDKILIGKSLDIKKYGVIPQEKFEFSDHKYIKARIIV